MKRRIAMQATHYRLAVPILERLRETYRARGDEEAARASELPLANCVHWTDAMLYVAHNPGMMHTGLPSAAELNHLRHMANLATFAVGSLDGSWLAGYMSSLPPDLARVVQSMLTTGGVSASRSR